MVFPAKEMPPSTADVKCYPSPLATHEQVVEQPGVFWDTLKRFHSSVGTKFMVPVIGGKELDLHVLYVEVTNRGGYDKVVVEKKWREISSVFEFSPTTTSASFVLKKHYYTYLLHYENVYFFRLQRPVLSHPTTGSTTPSRSFKADNGVSVSVSLSFCFLDNQCTNLLKPAQMHQGDDTPSSSTGSEEPLNFQAIGTIDAKFDCGYMVSVKLGSQTLRGVLYHPARGGGGDKPTTTTTSSSSPLPDNLSRAIVVYNPNNIPSQGSTSTTTKRRRRKLKKRRWGWDPSHPKPNRSGYNFFFADKHSALKSLYPNREREFTKMIGESWNKLTSEERLVYQNIGLKDKERYRRELKEYKENLKLMEQQQQQQQLMFLQNQAAGGQ